MSDLGSLCVVSGGDTQRLRSHVNHAVFANLHGFSYLRVVRAIPGLLSPYYLKLAAIRQALPDFDWVLWLDDDAFFSNFTANPLRGLMVEMVDQGWSLLLGDSPVSRADAKWTRFNAGVMLVRVSPDISSLLGLAMSETPDGIVADWWTPDRGYFTHSDQDSLLWAIETSESWDQVGVVDHRRLNARESEYANALDNLFIVHFPGVLDKARSVDEFALRYGLDDSLTPAGLQRQCGRRPRRPITPDMLERRAFRRRVLSKVRGAQRHLATFGLGRTRSAGSSETVVPW